MENGHIIKSMEKEFSFGLMGDITMESIIWIKRKDLVNLYGLMEGSILENGKMGNKREKENIQGKIRWRERVCGLMEKEVTIWMKRKNEKNG